MSAIDASGNVYDDFFSFVNSGGGSGGAAAGGNAASEWDPAPVDFDDMGYGGIVAGANFANASPFGPGGPFGGGGGGGGGPVPVPTSNNPPDPYTSGNADGSNYNIELVYMTPMSFDFDGVVYDFAPLFEGAADWLSWLITTDIYPFESELLGRWVDDVVIEVSIVTIDGSGGVLGRAGPREYRDPVGTDGDYLPVVSIIEFDVADIIDLAIDVLADDVIVHEMMHAIGHGTVWGYFGDLLAGKTNGRNADLYFTGEDAALANGGNFVFVETDGGSGTAGAHWNETDSSKQAGYDNELMTGYLNSQQTYVAAFTVASLQDIGYETQWSVNSEYVSATGEWLTPDAYDPFMT